jgi:hypothetical protein
MRKNELRQIPNNPPLPNILTNLSVESSRWQRLVARWRGRRHFTITPVIKEQESTETEIANIEARVRKELYPLKPKFYILPGSKNLKK